MSRILSFALALAFGLTALPAFAQKPSGTALADLADRLLPAVVNVSSTVKAEAPADDAAPAPQLDMPQFPEGSPFQQFFDEFQKQQKPFGGSALPATSLGSGFVIDVDKGYVVTNYHVVKDAEEIKLTLHDDTIVTAKLVGKDDKIDVALLKADLKGKKVAGTTFGNSDVMRVGDPVFAIGNPFGLGGTVTAGIISARARDINAGPYDDFLQTDASINRGNSGGPMFNMNGEVIGINTAIFSPTGGSVGIGFAIPSNMAKGVIDQLMKYGKTRRGWIGVKVQTVTEDIAKSLNMPSAGGAMVAEVTKDSPAAKAGIKAGDVILTFDGKKLSQMRQLPRVVAETEIDRDAPITYWRGGAERSATIKLGQLEKAEESGLIDNAPTTTDAHSSEGAVKVDSIGLKVTPLTKDLRARFRVPDDVNGVVVMGLDDKGDAQDKGLAIGDVIAEANQAPVTSAADIKAQIDAVKKTGNDTILLLVNRKGEIQFIGVKIK